MTMNLNKLLDLRFVHIVGNGPCDDSEFEGRNEYLTVGMNGHPFRRNIFFLNCDSLVMSQGAEYLVLNKSGQYFSDWRNFAHVHPVQGEVYDSTVYRGPHPEPALEWCSALGKELGTSPLTGIFAVARLLQSSLARLRISGFTFWEKDGRIPAFRDSHKLEPQGDWLRRKAETDARIVLAPEVRRSLYDAEWEEPNREPQARGK